MWDTVSAEISEAREYIDEVASRALGETPSLETSFQSTKVGQMSRANFHIDNAEANAHMGTVIEEGIRFTRLKQLILRATRFLTVHQVEYNRSIVQALRSLEGTDPASAGIEATMAAVADQTKEELDQLRALVLQLTQQREVDRTSLLTVRSRVEMLLKEVRRTFNGQLNQGQLARMEEALKDSLDEFYLELQQQFRGTREDVRERQKIYLDDAWSSAGTPTSKLLDLGCGRGEWLELLAEHQIPAYGIDTNTFSIQACREHGLDVLEADAQDHLRELPESSLSAITAFHLAEHLSFSALVELIDRSLIALKPGGCLIMETPNPTNLMVGAASFYLDPTHTKPLHPQFLEFLVVARGFVDVEVRFVNPDQQSLMGETQAGDGPPEFPKSLVENISWALLGPRDFAVIARKAPTAN